MKETTFEARKSLKTGGFARTFMNKNLKFIFPFGRKLPNRLNKLIGPENLRAILPEEKERPRLRNSRFFSPDHMFIVLTAVRSFNMAL